MKLSRRSLLALAGTGAAFPEALLGQAPPPPANVAATPDPVAAAREENRQAAETLEKFDIPMSTEPAFVFRVS